MSFFKGMFGGANSSQNNPQQHQPTPDPHHQSPTNSSAPPFTRPMPAGGHTTVSPASLARPDATSLARARQSRQAALAAAAFGSAVPAPTHGAPVHSQYGSQPHPQHGFTPGGPGGFGQPEPARASGGDMFDMFGGLDVKGSEPQSLFGGAPIDDEIPSEEASGFSFIDDSQPVDPEVANANGGYVFDATTNAVTDSLGESGFSFISEDTGASDSTSAFDYGAPEQSFVDPSAGSSSRLDNAKAFLDRSLSIFWQEWRQLTATESQLKQDEVQLQLGIRRDTAAMRDTEDKQGAAVAAEEYEKADAFNAELDRLKHSIESAQQQLRRAKVDIANKETQKQSAAERALKFLSDSESQLQSISSERQSELQSFINSTVESLMEKDAAINADMDRVKTSLSVTQGDLDQIEANNSMIDQSLTAESKPFLEEKENLINSMSTLEMDLEELKRQVAVKEREIAENHEKQLQADRAVELVKMKFAQQRATVTEKKFHIDQLRSRDVAQQTQIEARAKLVDDEIERAKQAERAGRITLHDIAESLAHTRYLTSLLSRESQERQLFISSLNENESQIDAYRHDLENYEANLSSIRSELLTVEQDVETHNKNISSINTKIPAMEAEKNAAVTARDFKKAAAASKEIKTLQQSKSDSEVAIEELKIKIKSFTETLSTADTKKIEIETSMMELENQTDKKRFHFVLIREKKLISRQSRVTSLLQRAYESVHQIHDDSNAHKYLDHLQKEVEAVDVELKWTQVEIRELKTKHPEWNFSQLTNLLQEELEDSDQEAEANESIVISHIDDSSLFDTIKKGGVNGVNQSLMSLGFPVIQSPSSSSSKSTASAASAASSKSTSSQSPKQKTFTQEDFDTIQSKLDLHKQKFTENESKLSEAIESEDFETAGQIGELIEKEKASIATLESELQTIQQFLEANKVNDKNEEEEANGNGNAESEFEVEA